MRRIVSMMIFITLLCISTGFSEQEDNGQMNRVFTNETLHECSPYTFNVEKAEALGLAHDGSFTDEYFELQAFYCEAL